MDIVDDVGGLLDEFGEMAFLAISSRVVSSRAIFGFFHKEIHYSCV